MIRTEFEYYINVLGGYKIRNTAFGIEFSINGIKGKLEKLKYGYYINFNGVTEHGTKRTVFNVLERYWNSIAL